MSIADLPTGTTWYVVNPGGLDAIQGNHSYAGPDRAEALDRVAALVAQGVDVHAGEQFRPDPADAYVAVARVERVYSQAFLGPASLGEEKALIAEARALLKADSEDHPETNCDECCVQPDGTNQDGTTCPCSIRPPAGGCRCTSSPAEWYGPAYIRAEIAAEES